MTLYEPILGGGRGDLAPFEDEYVPILALATGFGGRRDIQPAPIPTAAPQGDPLAALGAVPQFLSRVGGVVGPAFEAAARAPVVGPALRALGALQENVVDPAFGGLLLAGEKLTGGDVLSRRAAELGRERDFLGKVGAVGQVRRELGEAARQIREDPTASLGERAGAAVIGLGGLAQDVATPVIPGAGIARTALRAAAPAAVTTRAAATVSRQLARLGVRVGRQGAPTGRTVAEEAAERIGRVEVPPRDTRDLGFNESTTFSQLDPDVQRLVRREAEEAGGFAAQRRGVIPIEETRRMADDVGIDFDEALRTGPGRAMNAEELWAAARATARAATERKALQDEIARVGVENASTELQTRLLLKSVEQASLQRVFAGARTEAGRSLRILREALTKAEVERTPSAYDRALRVVGGRENAERFIQRLNDIWTRDVPDAAKKADTFRFLRSMGETTNFRRVNEVWVNSILSGLRTQEINFISNTVFGLAQPGVRLLAAGVEAATTLGGRTRPRQIFFSEAGSYALGMARGLPAGLRKALHILRAGYDLDDVTRWVEIGKFGRAQAIGGPVGAVINLPVRLLAASDAVFRVMGLQAELYAQATRVAAREGLSGAAFSRRVAELVANPTDDMLEAATKQSKYVTFQSEPDRVTRLLLQARREVPALGFVVPFVSTPVNLAKRGFEFSPAGFVIAAKATAGAARSTAIARAMVGSAVMSAFAFKFLSGELTGAPPKGQAQRDEWYRSGKQPYSVRIGDAWVEFSRLEPFLTPVRWMASAWDVFRESGEVDEDTAMRAISAFMSAVKDQTYLEGVANLLDAIEDPARFGETFLSRVASGFVPFSAALRSAAQATDPFVRQPEGIGERVAAGLPGLSQAVRPRLDAFGRPIERIPTQQGIGAVTDPRRVSPVRTDPVDVELARVRGAVPDLSPVGFVGRTVGGVKLDDAQRFRYQELAGRLTYERLSRLFSLPDYARLPEARKAKLIEGVVRDAREAARKALGAEVGGELRERTEERPRTYEPLLGGGRGYVSNTGPYKPLLGQPVPGLLQRRLQESRKPATSSATGLRRGR